MLLTRTLLQRTTRRLAARSFAGIEKTLDGKRSTEEERFIREQEKANKAKRDATVAEITTVGVVGLGLMGHGIAQISAAAGFQTVGVDLNSEVLANGQKAIETSVAKLNSRKASKSPDFDAPAATEETLARLSYASSIDAVAQCDLIVEAIVEDAAVKQTFYEDLGARAKPEAIFASNTSSLAVAPMAAASNRPDRFVGLHYFNPVQLMKLCEVVQTPEVDESVVELVDGWAKLTGKVTVRCKDTPGFIVNRLLVPNLAAAIAMAERGDAAIEDIDAAMCLGAGHPMGPLQLADYVGLDTCLSILQGWCAQYPDEPAFFVPPSLKAKVSEGKLGRKSGEGYYVWGDGPASTKPSGVSGL
jgi:3-hydroxyacyl-CoA dehydrogenase